MYQHICNFFINLIFGYINSNFILCLKPLTDYFGKDAIDTKEYSIGVLCFCDKKNTSINYAELMLYFTYHRKDDCGKYNALGIHSFTHPHYEGQGLNAMLRRFAVCLLSTIQEIHSDKIDHNGIVYIGSQAINPISMHIMQKHLG